MGLSRYSESKFANKWENWEIQYLQDNWQHMSDYLISQNINRTAKAVKAKRHELKYYRQEHDRELTYENLNKYLRGNTYLWKQRSISACNGKCVLTGSSNYVIHHLYNFQYILKEYFKIYKIQPLENINEYTPDELEYILKTFNEFHDTFPLGVCVDKELHKMFHHYYGKTFNTPEQWDEFKNNYMKGIYNH